MYHRGYKDELEISKEINYCERESRKPEDGETMEKV